MNEQFVHYVSTTEKEEIQPLVLLLEQNGIDYHIKEELAEENPTFHTCFRQSASRNLITY